MAASVLASNGLSADQRHHALGERLLAWAFAGLAAMLIWAPWPLGSNRPWATALLAGGIWLSVLLAAVGSAISPRSTRALRAWRYLPMAALLGFAGLVLLQLAPIWGADHQPWSIDLYSTRQYLVRTLAYIGAWFAVALTVRSKERAQRFLLVLVVAAFLQAMAAVLLWSGGARVELWFTSFDHGMRAMGTFPSPDNLAGYLELGLAAGLGWLLGQMGSGDGSARAHWRTRVVAVLDFMMSGKMLLRLLLVALVVALVMTHSRMGNAAFFLSLSLTGALVAVVSKRLRRPAMWLVGSMLLVDVLVIGQWVGLDQVVQRLRNTAISTPEAPADAGPSEGWGQQAQRREETLEQRMEIPLQSLELVRLSPWLGHGGGTYKLAFPPLKQAGSLLHWDHAHNDYVQVACDMGLLGLALLLVVGVASFFRAARLLRDVETRVNRGLGVAAVMALCCYGLHGLVDFNLHIPSNALTFTVLLAAVWAVPSTPKRQLRPSRRAEMSDA